MPIVLMSLIVGLLISMTAIISNAILRSQKLKVESRKDSEELKVLRETNQKLEGRLQNLEETFAEIDMDFLRLKPHDKDKI